jgi:hypothetical protein
VLGFWRGLVPDRSHCRLTCRGSAMCFPCPVLLAVYPAAKNVEDIGFGYLFLSVIDIFIVTLVSSVGGRRKMRQNSGQSTTLSTYVAGRVDYSWKAVPWFVLVGGEPEQPFASPKPLDESPNSNKSPTRIP